MSTIDQLKNDIMGIMETLDKEGLNIQETILNLKHQGYSDVYDDFLRYTLNRALDEMVRGYVIEELESIWKQKKK